jgi:hypothetical protein
MKSSSRANPVILASSQFYAIVSSWIDLKKNKTLWIILFIAGLTGLPFWAGHYLPFFDWPFHLARAYVLHDILNDGGMSQFYEIHSWLMPNIASDFVLTHLMSWFTPYLAGKLFVFSMLALTLFGVGLIGFSLHRKIQIIPLLFAAILIFNGILGWGFVNYLFGVALALTGIGSWMLIPRESFALKLTIGLLFSCLVYLSHLAAFGIYTLVLVTICCQELIAEYQASRKAIATDTAAALLSTLPFYVFFIVTSPMKNGASKLEFVTLKIKFEGLIQGFMTYDVFADIVAFFAILVFLGLVLMNWRSYFSLKNKLCLSVSLLALVYLISPHILFGSAFFESRLPIALLLLSASFVRDDLLQQKHRISLIGILVVAVFARDLSLGYAWYRYQKTYDSYLGCFESLPNAATIGAVRELGGDNSMSSRFKRWQPPVEWVGAYAVIQKNVFFPEMYADVLKQPITPRPPYKRLYDIYGNLVKRVDSSVELNNFIAKFIHDFDSLPLDQEQRNLYLMIFLPSHESGENQHYQTVCSGDGFKILKL